jgi:hypothetical protein
MGAELKMDENLQEDWLDARLRDEAPYIDDGGFTAKVIQRLPVSQRPRQSFRAIVLLCLTLLGSLTTYVVSGGGKFIGVGIDRIAALPVLWILILAVACSVVLTSLATAAAFSKTREETLG